MPTVKLALLSLPFELLDRIFELLPQADKRVCALVSHCAYDAVLPSLYRSLVVKDWSYGLALVHNARKEIKTLIRKFEIHIESIPATAEQRALLYLVLQNLPNLQSLTYCQDGPLIISRLQELLSVIRSVPLPLTEFILYTDYLHDDGFTRLEGLSDLRKLSVRGLPLNRLHSLIQPSLATLVSLKITDTSAERKQGATRLDLMQLRVAGETLREFEYIDVGHDDTFLATIPQAFPHLTSLLIGWSNPPAPTWKESHIRTLSQLLHLTSLSLSFDLEHADPAPPTGVHTWVLRSYNRRLKLSQSLFRQLPHLRRCSWVQLGVNLRETSYYTCIYPRLQEVEIRKCKPQIEHLFLVAEDGSVKGGVSTEWGKGVIVQDLPKDTINIDVRSTVG